MSKVLSLMLSEMGKSRNLIPLNKYTKPLLKLNEEDKYYVQSLQTQVDSLMKQVSILEEDYRSQVNDVPKKAYLLSEIEKLMNLVKERNTWLRDYKKNCYDMQLGKIDRYM